MTRIICAKCKNAYLQKGEGSFTCPSCEAVFPEADENLLLGAQYYNEGEYDKCDDCLMKYIVKAGAEPTAIFYKALCDGFRYNENTKSIDDVYEKLAQSLSELSDESFPYFLGLANDECAKLEQLIADMHIRQFETADAENIKRIVSILITLQNSAKDFRAKLTALADEYNEHAANKISVRFSKCFLVNTEIATEVGCLKFDRIAESIASHTVFTGILSTDIKNLEIYYRCIVMFFEKNRQKYDFLMASSEKFTELAKLLEDGKYSAIKGTTTIGDRLKGAAYDFFQESLKDHDDEDEIQQTESVVVLESETVDITELMDNEADEDEKAISVNPVAADDIEYEDLFSSSDADPDNDAEEAAQPEFEDITSDSAEDTSEDTSEDTTEDTTEDAETVEIAEVTEEDTTDDAQQTTEIEIVSAGADEITEDAADEDVVEVVDVEAAEEAPTDDIHVYENLEDDYSATEEIPIEEIVESTVVFDAVGEVDSATQELEDIIVDVESDEAVETEVIEEIDNSATIAIDTIKKNVVESTINDDEEAPFVEKAPRKKTKHKKSYGPFIAFFLILVIVGGIVALKVVPPKLKAEKYYQASQLAKDKKYLEAAALYAELEDYADADHNVKVCKYAQACAYEDEGKFDEAKKLYLELDTYANSRHKVVVCTYNGALAALDAGKYDEAIDAFKTIVEYSDSADQIKNCTYQKALALIDAGEYKTAVALLESLDGYKSSSEKILEAKYGYVKAHMDAKDETTMTYIKDLVEKKYLDSAALRKNLVNPESAPTTTQAPETTAVDATANATTEASTTTAQTTKPVAQDGKIRAYINYSQTDTKTAETKVDGSKKLYFHVEVNDPQYHGKNLKIYYKTSVGYETTSSSFTVDKNNPNHSFEYASSFGDSYTLEFQLRDESGKAIAIQTVSVN